MTTQSNRRRRTISKHDGSHLWLPDTRIWKDSLLYHVLTDRDSDVAKKLMLLRYAKEYNHIWFYAKNAHTQLNLDIGLARHLRPPELQILALMGSQELKAEFWKLSITPKVQQLFWIILAAANPTADRLISRHMNITLQYQRYCMDDETINHILFTCNHAQATWRASNIPHQRL